METSDAFRRVYAGHVRAVLGYAVRRTSADDAPDVVAETFLIAWRRWDDVPAEPETLPWLYGVARRVLANQRRGAARRTRLGERLRTDLAAHLVVPDPAEAVAEVRSVRGALARLDRSDREVMLLSAWEQLAPREIAVVLGISPEAARARLSRARNRLRRELMTAGHEPDLPGHVHGVRSVLVPKEDR